MPPDNLLQLLQSQMSPAQAVSTGAAHDEINKFINQGMYFKGEFKPSSIPAFATAHEQENIIPIDMENFAELFKMGFSKNALERMMKNKEMSRKLSHMKKEGFDDLPVSHRLDIAHKVYESIDIDKNKLDEYYNTISSRVEKGDAPGGMVAYAFPDYSPELYGEPGSIGGSYTPAFFGVRDKLESLGVDVDSLAKTVPDTMSIYAPHIQEFLKGGRWDEQPLLSTIMHEPLHAAVLHNEEGYGQREFRVASNRMVEAAEEKIRRDGTMNAEEKQNKLIQMISNLLNPQNQQ
jgi:hypothetical protein